MDKKKKVIGLITAICIIGIILFFLWPHIGGNISNVNRTNTQSEVYSEQDIADAMAIISNFKVDSSGGDGSMNPGETYTDWQWILVHDKESSKWKLETWGY